MIEAGIAAVAGLTLAAFYRRRLNAQDERHSDAREWMRDHYRRAAIDAVDLHRIRRDDHDHDALLDMRQFPPAGALEGIRAVTTYDKRSPNAIVRQLVRLKFGRPDLAQARLIAANLAHYLAMVYAWSAWDATLVICPPSSKRSLLKRGYNQAEMIAEATARRIGVRFEFGALERVKETAAQVEAGTRAARIENAAGAYRAMRKMSGQHVVIIDDVMTTGATLEAIAAACKQAGASSVGALVIAAGRRV